MNGSWKIAALSLLALALASACGGSSAGAAQRSWIDLDGGTVGKLTWTVSTNGGSAAGASELSGRGPCLRVGAMWRTGPFSLLRQRHRACAPAAGRPRASQAPVIAGVSQPSNGAAKVTALGILAPAPARRLLVTHSGGAVRSIALDRVDPSTARATGLVGYRYAALVVGGAWCVERVVTVGASGRVLSDSGSDEYACSTASD